MFEEENQTLNQRVLAFCNAHGLPVEKLMWRKIPFSGEWGMAAPLFPLAAEDPQRSGPVPQHAQTLAVALKEALGELPGFSRSEAVKGYLNLYYETSQYAQEAVNLVLETGENYGSQAQTGDPVMVEYSNVNTHKPIHVGHLRNVILGGTICRILEASGKPVVRANYIGDIGLHVMKWLYTYQRFHAGEEPPQDIMRWMSDIYTEAERYFSEDPEYEAAVRAYFNRWDAGDAEVKALWEKTRTWSMDGFMQTYALLDEHFDRIYFESEVEEPGKELVEELVKSGLAEDGRPENPVIIDLDKMLGTKEEYRVVVLLRSDGTSLYSTKELPLAMLKFKEYPLELSIYVVDVRQTLHFKQAQKILELMDYAPASRMKHLAYEIVNLPGNVTMSSRDGTVVLLDDLVREACTRAQAIVEEKNPDLCEHERGEIAMAVALGAIKYPMISRETTKVVTFDWESALDFNGQSAPYIQYAHVRANSILRKAGEMKYQASSMAAKFSYPLEIAEVNLVEKLTELPDLIQRAAAELKPSLLTTYGYELAKSFNDFYNSCPVLNAEPAQRNDRLALVSATRFALGNTLKLLGIQAPDAM